MSEREFAMQLLDDVPEYKLGYVIAYMQGMIAAEEPNETTYAAMEAAAKGEDLYGPFESVSALMEALNA